MANSNTSSEKYPSLKEESSDGEDVTLIDAPTHQYPVTSVTAMGGGTPGSRLVFPDGPPSERRQASPFVARSPLGASSSHNVKRDEGSASNPATPVATANTPYFKKARMLWTKSCKEALLRQVKHDGRVYL